MESPTRPWQMLALSVLVSPEIECVPTEGVKLDGLERFAQFGRFLPSSTVVAPL